VTFFVLQLDRASISQALASKLLQDLKMTSNDYNLGQTIFLVCFLLAELLARARSLDPILDGPINCSTIAAHRWNSEHEDAAFILDTYHGQNEVGKI
jgi:hypothetical protein